MGRAFQGADAVVVAFFMVYRKQGHIISSSSMFPVKREPFRNPNMSSPSTTGDTNTIWARARYSTIMEALNSAACFRVHPPDSSFKEAAAGAGRSSL
jgi:hypothetical protein